MRVRGVGQVLVVLLLRRMKSGGGGSGGGGDGGGGGGGGGGGIVLRKLICLVAATFLWPETRAFFQMEPHLRFCFAHPLIFRQS